MNEQIKAFLYGNYGKTTDPEIIEAFDRLIICKKTDEGYREINMPSRFRETPRGVSTNFNDDLNDVELELEPVASIPYLVKSSSHLFLKADLGEVLDQAPKSLMDNHEITGICIHDDYYTLNDPSRSHFIMMATFLRNADEEPEDTTENILDSHQDLMGYVDHVINEMNVEMTPQLDMEYIKKYFLGIDPAEPDQEKYGDEDMRRNYPTYTGNAF